MNPQDNSYQPPADYNPHEHVDNALTVNQPGEQMICEIKRHPIGIFGIYIAIGFMLIVTAVLAFIVVPSVMSNSADPGQVTRIGAAVFAVLALVAGIYGLIVTKVYWGNRWIVTSDSVTQVSQTSLFNRESAQLSMAHIEDVTSEQNGIASHMFNFGVIKVETAGHLEKFMFLYCPNPNFYAKQILQAREAFEMHMHGTANSTPPPPNYVPPQLQNRPPQEPPTTQSQPPAGTDSYEV